MDLPAYCEITPLRTMLCSLLSGRYHRNSEAYCVLYAMYLKRKGNLDQEICIDNRISTTYTVHCGFNQNRFKQYGNAW